MVIRARIPRRGSGCVRFGGFVETKTQQKGGCGWPAAAAEMSPERMKGKVIWFNTVTGSGFINPDNGCELLFFHQPSLKSDDYRSLSVGDTVEFEVRADKYGCPKAFNITAPGGGALAGCFRPAGGNSGGGDGVRYSRDDDLGCGGGSGDGVHGFYNCGKEVAALPAWSEGTALHLFYEMPDDVIYDEELLHGFNSDDSLLLQLAQGQELMGKQENAMECSLPPSPQC